MFETSQQYYASLPHTHLVIVDCSTSVNIRRHSDIDIYLEIESSDVFGLIITCNPTRYGNLRPINDHRRRAINECHSGNVIQDDGSRVPVDTRRWFGNENIISCVLNVCGIRHLWTVSANPTVCPHSDAMRLISVYQTTVTLDPVSYCSALIQIEPNLYKDIDDTKYGINLRAHNINMRLCDHAWNPIGRDPPRLISALYSPSSDTTIRFTVPMPIQPSWTREDHDLYVR